MQKKWYLGIVMLLMAMFALVGCGGGAGESALIGTWKMDTTSIPTPAAGNQMQQMGAEMAKGMLQNVTLDFKSDKTFSMNMIFQLGGDWTFNSADNTVTLNATKMGNMDMRKMPGANASQQKPMVLTMSSDGQHLTMQSPNASGGSGTLNFVKSS